MFPHAGSWRDAQSVRRGYEVNVPLFPMQVIAHDGKEPAEKSFLFVENENVIVTALKKAEDSNELILRFYEWSGKEADVKIEVPSGVQSAADADLQEIPQTELKVANNTVTVHTKPFEIKTVLLRYPVKQADSAMQMH
jgi:alpha-mannosidase